LLCVSLAAAAGFFGSSFTPVCNMKQV
jgi:hypothetical protein